MSLAVEQSIEGLYLGCGGGWLLAEGTRLDDWSCRGCCERGICDRISGLGGVMRPAVGIVVHVIVRNRDCFGDQDGGVNESL